MTRSQRFVSFISPIITEKDQDTRVPYLSKMAVAAWIFTALDVFVVIYDVLHKRSIPDLGLILNFLIFLTVFAWGYVTTHKVILMKSPISIPGLTNGNGNGHPPAPPAKCGNYPWRPHNCAAQPGIGWRMNSPSP